MGVWDEVHVDVVGQGDRAGGVPALPVHLGSKWHAQRYSLIPKEEPVMEDFQIDISNNISLLIGKPQKNKFSSLRPGH